MNASEDALPRRVPSARERLVDAVVAGVLLLTTAITVPLSSAAGDIPVPALPLVILWALLVTVPLAFRRSLPAVVAVVVVCSFLGGQAIGVPEYLVSQVAPFLALYTLGAWSSHRRRSLVTRIALSLVVVGWFVIAVAVAGPTRAVGAPNAAAVAFSALSTVLYLGAAIAFGEVAWRSAVRRDALAGRTAELQRERELTARQAVALERARIARELHDIVAHHVSVIGVQAGAARRVLDSRPDAAAAALGRIEESSRQAVDELRRTVIALRDGDDDPGPSQSPSTLGVARIPDLVSASIEAGVPTEYELRGDGDTVSAGAALALHRITQEALTNVRKHAGPGARASVVLVIADGSAELTVVDRGGSPSRTSGGTGMGQIGMRERAAAVGGTLEAGSTADGYRVRAVLPKDER